MSYVPQARKIAPPDHGEAPVSWRTSLFAGGAGRVVGPSRCAADARAIGPMAVFRWRRLWRAGKGISHQPASDIKLALTRLPKILVICTRVLM